MELSAEPIIYGLIFVGVLALVEGVYLTVFGKSISLNSRVNRRLEMMDKGARRDEVLEKRIVAGRGWGPAAYLRSGHTLDTLLYPGEPPIAADHPLEAVEVAYPPQDLSLLGIRVNWLIGFLILSMAFGFAFKGVLGVEV